MQSKARMTFRFEQPKPNQSMKPTRQPLSLDDKSPIEEEMIVQEDFTSLNGSYQDDIHALEEIIRRSDSLVRHPHQYQSSIQSIPIQREELQDEQWGLVQPDVDDNREIRGSWIHAPASIREGPSWGRVFLSVGAAVATGALFGYIVLSLFTGESLFPGKPSSPVAITDQTAAEQKDIPAKESSVQPLTSEAPAEPGVETSLSQVPAAVYYMLQYGVFQSEESMQTAIKELKDQGLAAASEKGEDYRVYVGAAATRDEAELLAAQMSNIEVYIKAMEGMPLVVPSSALPEGAAAFLNATAELTGKLIRDTGSRLQDKLPQVMNDKDLSALKDTHRQWLSTASVTDILSDRAIQEVEAIIQALDSAMLSMNEFELKPSRYQLWTAQSALMKAVIADRHLRSILQPSKTG